mgnify:CR=1 FL=1|jgi:hypothetical protein|tara:strand:- start:104 stop:673 length:570 start_codon:yes stop_codon:yes gene_type:complete
MKKIKAPSEGELFILEYLKHKKISFEREVRLNNLRFDDDFGYRDVDFYLKKYGVYIEFNGMWNNTKEDRVRYRKKKEVYRKNNIPCIYLYPENLGIIDFVFTKRLIEEMKKKKLTKELRLFQLKRFIDDRGSLFAWMILSIILLCGDFNWQEDSGTIMFFVSVGIFQIYRLIQGVYKFFIKNSPEFKMN